MRDRRDAKRRRDAVGQDMDGTGNRAAFDDSTGNSERDSAALFSTSTWSDEQIAKYYISTAHFPNQSGVIIVDEHGEVPERVYKSTYFALDSDKEPPLISFPPDRREPGNGLLALLIAVVAVLATIVGLWVNVL